MTTLALLQCDMAYGHLQENAQKLVAACASQPASSADLRIAPLEALTGPLYGCQRRQPDFAESGLSALTWLATQTADGPPLLCGTADGQPVLLEKGQINPLPDFFRWRNLGFSLGLEPQTGADVSLGLHIRPFTSHAQGDWELILSGIARQIRCHCISVNIAAGCGQHIYHGQSVAMDRQGQLLARARAFAPDCLLLHLDKPDSAHRIEPLCATIQEAQWLALSLGLRDFVRHAGGSRVIIGLSGGLDSALVAAIAKDALGADAVHGVLMPSPYTSEASIRDATELAANLGIPATTIPITPMLKCFREQLQPHLHEAPGPGVSVAEQNLQARVRAVILMALANSSGALVLNTGNKSEAAMGYTTLYGDSIGAVAVIGDLFKTQVYELAHWLNARENKAIIPAHILSRPPSAELAPNQKDTDSLPPYGELDEDLAKIFAGAPEVAREPRLQALRRRVQANVFKRRQTPPPLIVSTLHPCQGEE